MPNASMHVSSFWFVRLVGLNRGGGVKIETSECGKIGITVEKSNLKFYNKVKSRVGVLRP